MTKKHMEDSRTENTYLIMPKHINCYGRLFGGILMQWIDEVDLILNGVELEIFAPAQKDHEHQLHPARPNFPEAYGLRHLAFTVTDIEKTAAELRKKGIETEPVRVDEFSGGKFTFFKDPDGLPLELHE